MAKKPQPDSHKPSAELALFTDREEYRNIFSKHLNSPIEPPVLTYYGVGGAGKTWLLGTLRSEIPSGVPQAFLDLDYRAGGERYISDPARALFEIRQQLGCDTHHFDLAFAMRAYKLGYAAEPAFKGEGFLGVAFEVVGEILQKTADQVPGLNILVNHATRAIFDEFLKFGGNDFLNKLRTMTTQEIEKHLLSYLSDDLRSCLPPARDRAIRAVLFIDTFEAIRAGLPYSLHRQARERWFQELAAKLNFVLVVIAGHNRLDWDRTAPGWTEENLVQCEVKGLSDEDSRQFLNKCGIPDKPLQDAILAVSREPELSGHHCFSLGLCADIVYAQLKGDKQPCPAEFDLRPQDWGELAIRFLRSLGSNEEERWIRRLAATPRFDKEAACEAFSPTPIIARESAWESLMAFSFVERFPGSPGWYSLRSQMREAINNNGGNTAEDHTFWHDYWDRRSSSLLRVNEFAGLAWYHTFMEDPDSALKTWERLTSKARFAEPPRMLEHWALIGWWSPIDLFRLDMTPQLASCAYHLSRELLAASIGSRRANLERVIALAKSAMEVQTEHAFPLEWSGLQIILGRAYSGLPSEDPEENRKIALSHFRNALMVRKIDEHRQSWIRIQIYIGEALLRYPNGDITQIHDAINQYKRALQLVDPDQDRSTWIQIQTALGSAYNNLATSDSQRDNATLAVACLEKALKLSDKQVSPIRRARMLNGLGGAYLKLSSSGEPDKLVLGIQCLEEAHKAFTQDEFPQDWAQTLANLGSALSTYETDDAESLVKAASCYRNALRVYRKTEFPQEYARVCHNLGRVLVQLRSENRTTNLRESVSLFKEALEVRKENTKFNWALSQCGLANALIALAIHDQDSEKNLHSAITLLEDALPFLGEHNDWARAQQSLGDAYSALGKINPQYFEKSIECLDHALSKWPKQASPVDWARTMTSKGQTLLLIYSNTTHKDEQLTGAKCSFQNALTIFTDRYAPIHYAICHIGIGRAALLAAKSAVEFVEAIKHQCEALTVTTKRSPEQWSNEVSVLTHSLLKIAPTIQADEGVRALRNLAWILDEAFSFTGDNSKDADWPKAMNCLEKARKILSTTHL